MPTTIPRIRVTRVEAGNGFQITCSQCPTLRLMRATKADADLAALAHERTTHRSSHTETEE